MKTIKYTTQYILLFLTIAFVACISYFGVIAAKNISYSYFYKEKVVTTIKENVKGSCLK